MFKPHVIKSKSYIKDSQNLIQISENLTFIEKPNLYSLDFTSLYSNINPEQAIPVITEFMSGHLNTTQLDTFGLIELLKLIFVHNIFHYLKEYFVQNKGVTMGCICGSSLASLYLRILEEKLLLLHTPKLYVRFIDDIFLALMAILNFLEFQSSFGGLRLTMNTGNEVNFLDTVISFNKITNKLSFDFYIKPTNNGGYLLPSSEHPKHIFDNIPRNLFLRIRRICSEYKNFVVHATNLSIQLLNRGYNKEKLIKTFNVVSKIDRRDLIPYNLNKKITQKKEANPLFFVNSYSNNFQIDHFVQKSFNRNINKQETLKLNMVCVYFYVYLKIIIRYKNKIIYIHMWNLNHYVIFSTYGNFSLLIFVNRCRCEID